MSSIKLTYDLLSKKPAHVVKEEQIEYGFIGKLQDLKYEYRTDIRDRAALERNFRDKFEALNRVNFSDGEFKRLLEGIDTLKTHKKGLMQQLFPEAETVEA
jgi:type I restriction enzyme R subunit